MVDYRKVIGSTVIAKCHFVTSDAECSRRYGANKDKKTLEGIVVEVVKTKNPKTNRTSTKIVADYNLGGGTIKRSTINVRSLVAKPRDESVSIPTGMPVATITAPEARNDTPTRDTNNNVSTPQLNAAVNENQSTEMDETMDIDSVPPVPFVTTPIRRNTNNNNDNNINDNDDNVNINFMDDDLDNNTLMASIDTAATQAHDMDWFDAPSTCLKDINGAVLYRDWGVRTATGNIWRTGFNVDERISRLDVFLQMFPPAMMNVIVTNTNKELNKLVNKKEITKGELLKFFGIIILATKYEFTKRSSLWSSSPPSKYESAPNFGKTRMPRARFDDIWRCIRYADQPDTRPTDMSSEKYRWLLVDEFVNKFNEHRASTFIPSEVICVDESISRWYGQGGDWINHGLPMYVAIDRKPENGCEIQNAACGRSGVMLRLKLVKTKVEETSNQEEDHDDDMLHGTEILLLLIEPWNFSDRIVCADSYFASVMAANELLKVKMRFIGVVKTATTKYPMKYLNTLELQERGDRSGLIAKDEDGKPYMLSFVWMDRERRYFIATASSLSEGAPYIRERWRQVNEAPNAPPDRIQLTVSQPKAAEIYYNSCGKIDQHNRDRQDTLSIERKLKTHDWSTRVNLSLLSMCFVDTWRVYSRITFGDTDGEGGPRETQKEFYSLLAEELIDNTYDYIGGQRRRVATPPAGAVDNAAIDQRTGAPRSGTDVHLTPTKRKRKNQMGQPTRNSFQGRCSICQQKTIYQCSKCKDEQDDKDVGWLCHTASLRMCFPQHLCKVHAD